MCAINDVRILVLQFVIYIYFIISFYYFIKNVNVVFTPYPVSQGRELFFFTSFCCLGPNHMFADNAVVVNEVTNDDDRNTRECMQFV